jgi:hypothetical protein
LNSLLTFEVHVIIDDTISDVCPYFPKENVCPEGGGFKIELFYRDCDIVFFV